MQLGWPFRQPLQAGAQTVTVASHPVPVEFVRNRRARHYILRVRADGTLRVTVPWLGSRAAALRFVEERGEWIERERHKRSVDTAKRKPWQAGTLVLFGGRETAISVFQFDLGRITVSFADQSLVVPAEHAANLRPCVERHLRQCATIDLPERVARLALEHGFEVTVSPKPLSPSICVTMASRPGDLESDCCCRVTH